MNEDTEEGEHRWYQPAPRRPSPMQDAFKRPTLPYRKRKFEALDSNTTSTDGPLLEDPSSFESAASLRPTALGKGLSDSTTPLPQVMEDPKADNDRPREEGADILPRDVATSDSEELESLFLHLVKTFHSHPPSRENSADTSQYKPSKEGRSYFTPDGRGSSMPPRPSTEPETRVAQEVLDSTPHPLQPMEGSRSQQMTFLAMKLSTASPPYQVKPIMKEESSCVNESNAGRGCLFKGCTGAQLTSDMECSVSGLSPHNEECIGSVLHYAHHSAHVLSSGELVSVLLHPTGLSVLYTDCHIDAEYSKGGCDDGLWPRPRR